MTRSSSCLAIRGSLLIQGSQGAPRRRQWLAGGGARPAGGGYWTLRPVSPQSHGVLAGGPVRFNPAPSGHASFISSPVTSRRDMAAPRDASLCQSWVISSDWRERAGDVPSGTGRGRGQAGVRAAGISVRRMDSAARTLRPLAPCSLGPHARGTMRRAPARGRSRHGPPGTARRRAFSGDLGVGEGRQNGCGVARALGVQSPLRCASPQVGALCGTGRLFSRGGAWLADPP